MVQVSKLCGGELGTGGIGLVDFAIWSMEYSSGFVKIISIIKSKRLNIFGEVKQFIK